MFVKKWAIARVLCYIELKSRKKIQGSIYTSFGEDTVYANIHTYIHTMYYSTMRARWWGDLSGSFESYFGLYSACFLFSFFPSYYYFNHAST